MTLPLINDLVEVSPKPGDAFTQFGVRLVILSVDEDRIQYCCRQGRSTGPVFSMSHAKFRKEIESGSLLRLGDGL